MADDANVNVNPVNNDTEPNNNGPSVDELVAQLAAARADAERYKSANDKLSKSEAEMKRQLRAKQTAEEAEAAAKAEAEKAREEEFENMRKELNHNKAVSAYRAINDEKVIENLIGAIADSDHVAVAQIIANECKKAVAEAEAQWLKDRPRVQHGQYSGMSRDQIMAIADRNERMRAIATNKELFE